MADRDTTAPQDLPAGRFSTWLLQVGRAQDGASGVEVPCGTCSACCTSSQFVHVGPDEAETIARIPEELLFPAPGLPRGHRVLGYDERGHCPMFVGGGCSIYDHRPRTCRTYDCRVLPAAGLELDDEDKARITERTRRWRFALSTPRDAALSAAVQAAAAFLRAHARQLPDGLVPRNPTQLAFLSIRVHALFLDDGVEAERAALVTPSLEVVEAALRRARTDARD